MSTRAWPSTYAVLSTLLAGIAVWMSPSAAESVEVYINGTKTTGLIHNQTFSEATIRFDAQGDIHIEAPGYSVEVLNEPTAKPTQQVAKAPRLSGRFWVVVDVPAPGHYMLSITANSQHVAEVPAANRQHIVEITDKMSIGPNAVVTTFMPKPTAPRIRGAPIAAVSVLVGEGTEAADGTLTISRVLGSTKLTTGERSAMAHPLRFELRPQSF